MIKVPRRKTGQRPVDDIYEFRWSVPEAGFEVLEAKYFEKPKKLSSRTLPFLVQRLDLENTLVTIYSPLAQTGLFKEFASLGSTPNTSVVDFANSYGQLGHDSFSREIDRTLPKGGLPIWVMQLLWGESLSAWGNEVMQLKHWVDLWEAARDNDDNRLSRWIKWTPDHSRVFYQGPRGFTAIAAQDYRPELLKQFMPGDTVRPAWHALQHGINKKLSDYGAQNRLLWDSQYTNLHLRVAPANLISAIWLQFALAVEGNKDHRQCEQCRKWFEVGASLREDAKFCGDPCRFKAYRNRQKIARQLHAEKVPIREIAKKLQSNVKTINRWISQ